MTDDTDMILHNAFWQHARNCPPTADAVLMETEARYHLTQALGYLMSDASEELYCAGWLGGLEDDLPYALLNDTAPDAPTIMPWSSVDDDARALMCAIAKGLGHWANWEGYERGDQYVPYMPKCLRVKG